MRAAVLHEAPGDLVVEDLIVAEPVGREVLIRTKASGLCHSDLHVIEGLLPLPSLPAALGHEASGIVEAIGPDVTVFAPGDHVITCLTQFCGVCSECHAGRVFICPNRHGLARGPELPPTLSLRDTPVLPMTGLGAFAEQMLVHENGVVAIDHSVPFDVAALIGCAVMTGVGSAVNGARIRPGEAVAVIGCGGIGLNIVQGCRLAGAGRIIDGGWSWFKIMKAGPGRAATLVPKATRRPQIGSVQCPRGGDAPNTTRTTATTTRRPTASFRSWSEKVEAAICPATTPTGMPRRHRLRTAQSTPCHSRTRWRVPTTSPPTMRGRGMKSGSTATSAGPAISAMPNPAAAWAREPAATATTTTATSSQPIGRPYPARFSG